jgi:hypothetical protein
VQEAAIIDRIRRKSIPLEHALDERWRRLWAATEALLLGQAGFSLQANRKTHEGKSHPDRNAQFEYIQKQVKRFQRRRQPVISVDTKKKDPELAWQAADLCGGDRGVDR